MVIPPLRPVSNGDDRVFFLVALHVYEITAMDALDLEQVIVYIGFVIEGRTALTFHMHRHKVSQRRMTTTLALVVFNRIFRTVSFPFTAHLAFDV